MKILCGSMPTNDLGLPSRLLPIAAQLRSRGHEVAFANPAPAPAKLIASAAFPNLDLPPASVAPTFPEQTSLIRDFDHLLALIGYCDVDYTSDDVRRCVAVLESWRPDVVLDSLSVPWCTAAEIVHIPLVEVLQGDFHPDTGFMWWMPREPSPTPIDAFNAVLARAGLPPVERAAQLLLTGATVVVGSPATDPVPDPNLRHVGVLSWGVASAHLPPKVPSPGRRPLVFLYSGTLRYSPGQATAVDSAVVLGASVEALADMDVDVVVGAGNQALPARLPSNFIPLDYVNGPALARRADVMIHHGGHGSTLTALSAGTSALIIPTYSERESNGRRVAALGAGLCLVPQIEDGEKRLDPNLVADAVQALLEDSGYLTAAQAVARDLAALPGARAVADVVEDVYSPSMRGGPADS